MLCDTYSNFIFSGDLSEYMLCGSYSEHAKGDALFGNTSQSAYATSDDISECMLRGSYGKHAIGVDISEYMLRGAYSRYTIGSDISEYMLRGGFVLVFRRLGRAAGVHARRKKHHV